jgi:hypothetical protein
MEARETFRARRDEGGPNGGTSRGMTCLGPVDKGVIAVTHRMLENPYLLSSNKWKQMEESHSDLF